MQFAITSALVQKTTHQLGTTNQAQWNVATNCFYQGFLGSWQFFLEGCRAFHSGSKHSLSPTTVCLNHMVIHKYTELYLTFSKWVDKLLVMKSSVNILKFTYFNIVFYSFFFFFRYFWSNKWFKNTQWACLNACWHVYWHVGLG